MRTLARIRLGSIAARLTFALALLAFSSVRVFAAAIGVSYTVTGAPGAWALNFSFTNNVPGQVLYFFGVNLPAQDVLSSPSGFVNCWSTACGKTTINPSTDLAPVTTSLNETFNDLWHIAQNGNPPVILFGKTASGFEALANTLTAPASVDWFALTAIDTLPYIGNENIPFSGDCISFEGVTCAVEDQQNPLFAGTGSPVPEPGTVVLFVAGLIALIGLNRRFAGLSTVRNSPSQQNSKCSF